MAFNQTMQYNEPTDEMKAKMANVSRGLGGQQTTGNYIGQGQSTPYKFTPTPYQQPARTNAPYQQFQYQAPQLYDKVSPAYDQMMKQAQTSGMRGLQTGLEQTNNQFGRRGIQGSGLGRMGLNQATAVGSNALANTMGQLGLQKAQGLGQLEQAQAGLNQWQQQQQAGEGQFGANFGEQQYQLDRQLQNLDRQMDQQEWATGRQIDQRERELRRNELMNQYQMDAGMRQEQYQQQMAPLMMLMQMFPGMMAGQTQAGQSGGLIPGLAGGAMGAGGMMTGLGPLGLGMF